MSESKSSSIKGFNIWAGTTIGTVAIMALGAAIAKIPDAQPTTTCKVSLKSTTDSNDCPASP